MKEETILQNTIRVALSERGCIVLRANVGTFYTVNGRRIHIGIDGHSDLYGHRKDGKAFYLEVKTKTGRLSKAQRNFLFVMESTGAIAGVARNVEEAISVVFGGENDG